ncbi:MAG: ATP-binding protein [Campylobacterales bacterium]|nr:ATP-binding protein [Campylobacterales bacterium]
MKILGYKNISRLIMSTTVLLILFNTVLISLFYYENQLNEFEENLVQHKYEKIKAQKEKIKDDIQKIVEMIEYKYDKNQDLIKKNRKNIITWISRIEFHPEKSNYIFVYELLDKPIKDKFATMIINPNRPDLIGKMISSTYKDNKGFAFREKFLSDIKKFGNSTIKYSYTKTNNSLGEKISHFYYYKPLNWIIAKGLYVEDIQQEIEEDKKFMEVRVKKQIKQNIFFFLFFSLIALIIAFIIGKRLQLIIANKDKKVKSVTSQMRRLNRDLDHRVKEAIEKNKKQERILMQRSKFTAMGEMISLIAHQWRQPISELGAIIMNMKFHYDLGKLDKPLIDAKTREMENLLEYMSNTIDDFRTFFKPDKEKEDFFFQDSFKRVIDISSAMLEEHKILLVRNIDPTLHITNYQNEFEQVALNIISNAKDALVSDKIQHPQIDIQVLKKEEKITIEICDNAKGINPEIRSKIFEPYFTTKEESDGTGIGLYMSKMIIEENMGGKISVDSSEKGTCFTIVF